MVHVNVKFIDSVYKIKNLLTGEKKLKSVQCNPFADEYIFTRSLTRESGAYSFKNFELITS